MTVHEGPMGRAELVPVPDRPDAAETVTWWLITAPRWSPMLVRFEQWVMGIVRLRDGIPGFPPPKRRFDGATHELFVATLNPEAGRVTPDEMTDPGYRFSTLQPMNVVEQFEATDAEMLEVADLAARAVADGVMCPEAWNHPAGNGGLSRDWLASITKTLAHIRGEEHAP